MASNHVDKETVGYNRIYHLEMMLISFKEAKFTTDTRTNIFIDRPERKIIIQLIERELNELPNNR